MKKLILIALIAIAASSAAFGQTASKDSKIKDQIIVLERAGWEAWKNKDASWIKTNATEEFLLVNSDGVSSKADVVKSTGTDCDVKSYSLDNFKFVSLDKDSILLTYTAMQDAVCSGTKLPANVRASVVYVKRGKRWLEALYMETPASK